MKRQLQATNGPVAAGCLLRGTYSCYTCAAKRCKHQALRGQAAAAALFPAAARYMQLLILPALEGPARELLDRVLLVSNDTLHFSQVCNVACARMLLVRWPLITCCGINGGDAALHLMLIFILRYHSSDRQ